MAGYVRQSSFVDGDTITAALFNDEYNQLVNAFHNSTGHSHDGTAASGPVIGLIGDAGETSPNNKVLIDTTNNYIEFYVQVSSSPVQQLYIADGAIVPVTDNDIDLGTSSLEFKDLYLDGTAHIDTLDVDANAGIIGNATVGGTLGVTGNTTLTANLTVNGNTTLGNAASDTVTITADVASHIIPSADSTYALGDSSNYWSHGYIDAVTTTGNVAIGGNLTVTGNATIAGNLTFGDAASDTVAFSADVASNLLPSADNTYDIGASGSEWKDLYIDGTANIDSLVADTADINGGTVDGAIIGGSSAAAITGTAITGTSFVIGSADINEAELETIDGVTAGTVAASKAIVVDSNKDIASFRNITLTGELDAGSLDVSGDADIDGTLEADAITVDGTALNEYIADTVGAMVGSNTETNITVTYEDGDNTLDFVIGTLNQDTTGTADNITVSANNSTDETVYPIFVDGATGSQGAESDTGLTYNPSSGDLTIGGQLVAATLDISGNVDVDGTLEADAITVNGTTLAETISDTVGAMVGSNTETGIAVTYDDSDNTLDFVLAAAQSTVTSLGTLTTLTVDNVIINGTTIGHTGDTDLITLASGVVTVAGELDATSLDISGDADIDGTLEADAITVDGTALNEYIADTVGAMVSSNTETDITVTYDDSDNTLDFVVGNITGTAALATSITASANNSTDETVYPTFVDGATGTQGLETDTGLTYNPSSGLLTTTLLAGTLNTAAQGNVTSLGTLTALTIDNVVIDGAVIGHTGDTDLITLSSGVVTVAGEVDATSLDISGNADIDGTLEADAYTVNGTNLDEYIEDTVGAMLSSNTETGITVTYEDGDSTIDFALNAAQTGITSLLATDIKIGEDDQTKIDFETADEIHFYAANAEQVYVADGIFGPQTDSDVDLGSTSVRWKDAYVDSITTTGNASVGGNLTLTGNLVVNGTTTTVNSTTVTIDDPIFTLGGDSAPGSDDNKDRGIEFRWHNGSAAKLGFFGYDDSASAFTFVPDATNSSEVFSGTVGNAIFGNITGTLQTAAQANITSLGTLTALTGGTGDFNWDSNTLVVDSSTNRVGIGNASPDVSLDIGSFTDAVHVPVGTTAQRPGSPAAGYFRYNTTTSKFEGYTDEWGSIGGGSGTNMDTNIYAGDGSDTTFTLSNAPDDEQNLMVFIDGVYQAHDSYSVSGTTLTFSTAPANGRVITVHHSTTTVGGSNNTINTMTGDNSDTTLTLSVAPVHENNVQVYFDGVYQSKSNYAISGTTLTFSTAPATGVLVEAITNTNTSSTTANILLDADSDTKIQVEESSDEDIIRFDIAGTEQIVLADGVLKPTTDNDIDLGTSSLEFKDLFLDGTAHVDTLDVDVNATVAGTLGVTGLTTLTGGFAAPNKSSVLVPDGTGDDDWAFKVSNLEATDGRSYGMKIEAGSTTNDQALVIQDHDGTNNLLIADGAGNLLMGTTSTDTAAVGFRYRASLDAISSVADGGISAYFGRRSSDGDIVSFRKDDATVGSIGVSGGNNLFISGQATNHAGITFATQSVLPTTEGALNNNTVDLGQNGNAFKDIWLGGGAYIGGTGSANKLDDYEEGVHEFTVVGGTSGSWTPRSGWHRMAYTKIGRQVTVTGQIEVQGSSSPSGEARISLPFAVGSTDARFAGRTAIHDLRGLNSSVSGGICADAAIGNAYFRLLQITDGGTLTVFSDTELDTAWEFNISMTYFTD